MVAGIAGGGLWVDVCHGHVVMCGMGCVVWAGGCVVKAWCKMMGMACWARV